MRRPLLTGLLIGLAVIAACTSLAAAKDPQVYIDRADAAFAAGDFKLAAQEYGKAIYSGADDATVFFRAAQASFELVSDADADLSSVERYKWFSQGISYLDAALQADPDFTEAQLLKTAMAWQEISGALRRGQEPDWELFIQEVSKLIELNPENAEAHFQRGIAHRAMMPRDQEKYGELAEADFQKAIELDPTNLTFLINGQIAFLEMTGKSDQAQAAYLAAVERDPDNVLLRANYVTFLYPTDPQGASQQIEQAIAIAAEQDADAKFTAQLVLADYYRWEERFEEAIEAYELAETIDPTMFGVYVTHTRLLRSLGRIEESSEVMRKAMKVAEGMLADADETEMSDYRRRQLAVAMIDLRYRLAGSLLDEIATTPDMDAESREARLQEARDTIKIIESQQDIRPLEPRYHRILGRIAMFENALDEALEHFLKGYEGAKARGRYDEHAGRLLLQMYIRDGQLAKAEAVIDEYLLRPRLGTLKVMLAKAQILMRYRNYDDARRVIAEVLEINPDHLVARAMLMQLAVEVDELRPDEVPDDMTLSSATIDAMVRQALRIWATGDKALALRQMENLYERAPENLKVIAKLIQMYQVLDMKDKAQAVLAEAIETYPDNDDLKSQMELMTEGSNEGHQIRLERAEQIADPLERALALADVMMLSDEADKLAQVIGHLRTAAEIDPRKSDCLEQMFRYCLQAADWEQAQWAVELAVEEDLDNLGGRLYKARLAAATDELQAAVDILTDILADKPRSKQARLLLGRCYKKMGEYDLAADAFRALYNADRSYATAAIEMMDLMILQGNEAEAKAWTKTAYRLAPNNTNVRDRYLAEGEGGKASTEQLIASREQTMRENPQDMQNRYWLAQLYEKAGRNREAERMYVSIYRDGPDRMISATILVDYYDRTNQPAPVDRLISELLEEMDDANDKALIYILWGQFRGKRNLVLGLKAFDQAIATAPTDPRPYEPKAALLARNGQWSQAAETMQAGLAMIEGLPDHDEALALDFTKTIVRYRIEASQLDLAEALLVKLMADHPDDVAGRMLRGVLVARRGNSDKAMEMFAAILETDPDYAPARAERARLYIVAGELGLARDDLKIAAKVVGGDNSVDMQLAYIYEQMDDYHNAKLTYKAILDRTPIYAPAIRRLAALCLLTEDWARLDALLTDAKRRFPDDPSYYLTEADALTRRGEPAKSWQALAEAVDVAPNDQSVVAKYLLTLVEAQEYQKAMPVADRYANREGFVWVIAIKARIHAAQGNADQAEQLFAKAVAEAQGRALQEVVAQMTTVYGVDDAITRLTAMMTASRPDDWEIRNVIAGLCAQSQTPGQLETALDLLTDALDLTEDPGDLPRIYVSLGQVNYMLGSFPESETAYLNALDFDEAASDVRIAALNNLAYMYAEDLDELAKAKAYAAQAARLAPSDPNVLDTYGWVLARLERYDEAIRYLDRSAKLARQPVTLYHLGYVYEQTGKRGQAAQNYEAVMEMLADQPGDPLYRQSQAGLRRLSE